MFVKEVSAPRKGGPPVKYVQIVESVREPGRSSPRHQVVLNLGRADQVERQRIGELVRLLSRFLGQDEAPLPDSVTIGQSRDLGVVHLAEGLWKLFDLERFFRKQLKTRKLEFPVERAIFAMVVHRLQEPTSKMQDFSWLKDEAFCPSAMKVELHHLYRALDFLQDNHRALEQALFAHRRELFNRTAELVFFDTTSVHFEVDEDPEEPPVEGLRQFGRPKDGRISHRQIIIGMAVDPDGLPLVTEVFSGNTADSKTILPVVARLKDLGVEKTVIVADRGMVSKDNLSEIAQAGLEYIVGLRLRRAGKEMDEILADKSPCEAVSDGLQAKRITLKSGRQVVVCFSSASAERDLKLRGRALERLNELMGELDRTGSEKMATRILSHKMFRRWVCKDAGGKLMVSREKVKAEAECDGTFVLETNSKTLSVAEVALGYKGLMRVEQAWASFKHSLDIQPVFVRLDERIEAHVMICMLGYLLERWSEIKTGMSFEEIRRQLRSVHATELVHGEEHLWKPGRLSTEQAGIYKKLEITPPKALLHSGPIPRLERCQM